MKRALQALGVGLLAIAAAVCVSGSILGVVFFTVAASACIGSIGGHTSVSGLWVPLLIGIVVAIIAGIAVFKAVINSLWGGGKQKRAPESTASASREQFAIEQYIDRAKAFGDSREQIESALRNGGWPDAEIQQAYAGYSAPR